MNIIERETCRVCGTAGLGTIYSLGELYVSNFLDKDDKSEQVKAPLTLVQCKNCGLVQLKHTAPQELMYKRHYWYQSGFSPIITADLQDIALSMQRLTPLVQGDVVLSIGCNDGTELSFYPDSVLRVGCEPAENLHALAEKRCDVLLKDFWNPAEYLEKIGKPAKIIQAIGMLYDAEDPVAFVRGMSACLAKDGVIVAQMMTLKKMLETADVGNICHEHLEFYNYKSLKFLFEMSGLEIFRIEENTINGGSYRIFARHLTKGSIAYDEEAPDWDDFVCRIENNRYEAVSFLKQAKSRGKKIYGYGASTKFNTVLQWYGLDDSIITAIADKSEEKIGKFTVGTNIRVCPEAEARKNADIMLIGPYAFTNFFVEREKEWLDKGGIFVAWAPDYRLICS